MIGSNIVSDGLQLFGGLTAHKWGGASSIGSNLEFGRVDLPLRRRRVCVIEIHRDLLATYHDVEGRGSRAACIRFYLVSPSELLHVNSRRSNAVGGRVPVEPIIGVSKGVVVAIIKDVYGTTLPGANCRREDVKTVAIYVSNCLSQDAG